MMAMGSYSAGLCMTVQDMYFVGFCTACIAIQVAFIHPSNELMATLKLVLSSVLLDIKLPVSHLNSISASLVS